MSNLTNAVPQFGTAEFKDGPERCKVCGQELGARYYRIGQNQACEQCGEKAKFEGPKDTHAVFVSGLVYGIGGAILGLIAYSTFGIVTGLVIGYLALLVGYLVGKAMMKGSKGVGGRRYQVVAVLLTYAAVSMSAIPIGISQIIKQKNEQKKNLVVHPNPESGNSAPSAVASDDPSEEADQPSAPAKPKMSFGAAVVALLFAGLASPFLELQDPFHGVIGLIILSVGIRIAWRLTAGTSTEVLGPFDRRATETSGAS